MGSKALADELGEVGKGVVISQVVPFPYKGSNQVVRDYQREMAAARQKELDFSSFEGYLAARVMVEGLKRAGNNLNREGLITALETLRNFNLGGFVVNYSPSSHEGSNFTDLTIIGSNGKFLH